MTLRLHVSLLVVLSSLLLACSSQQGTGTHVTSDSGPDMTPDASADASTDASSPDADVSGDAATDTSGDATADASTDASSPETGLFTLSAYGTTEELGIGDEGQIPYMWGFQGGTMIRPLIIFSEDAGVALGDALTVVFRHEPDPNAPEDYLVDDAYTTFSIDSPVTESDGRLILGPFNDQLNWVAIDGARLVLHVTIRQLDATLSRSLAVYLDDSDPCAPFGDPDRATDACGVATATGLLELWGPFSEGSVETDIPGCDGPVLGSEGAFYVDDRDAYRCTSRIFPESFPMPYYIQRSCLGSELPEHLSLEVTVDVPFGECDGVSSMLVIDGLPESCICGY